MNDLALSGLAIDQFGCVDVWINNAGVGALCRLERILLDDHVTACGTILSNEAGTIQAKSYQRHRPSAVSGCRASSKCGRPTIRPLTSSCT